MMDPLGQDNIREYLTAFADGELDAARVSIVLKYLADHPEAVEMMRIQQQLSLTAKRVFTSSAPRMPADLRRQIAAMTPDQPPTPKPQIARIVTHPWPRIAIAASLLLVGLLVGHFTASPSLHPVVVVTATPPVPATVVADASRIHADCSRLDGALHSGGYPRELTGLESLVREDLKSANPYPDLSSMGFRFIGAGPCAAPMANTAHLLYHSIAPGPRRTLSVFVQKYKGQFALERGKVYVVSSSVSPFPVEAWRTGDVVYFLIGDDEKIEATAQAKVRIALGL